MVSNKISLNVHVPLTMYIVVQRNSLNFKRKHRPMEVAQQSLNEVDNDAELLKRLITGDETWVYTDMTSRLRPNR